MSKDGGPAFPVPEGNYISDGTYTNPGMTLRDWFAGQALAGLLASEQVAKIEHGAEDAYRLADAMLAERDKNK